MTKEPKEKWWDGDDDFSTWFDREYGTTDLGTIAVGIVSSVSCHERILPFGSSKAYLTKKLEDIFSSLESSTLSELSLARADERTKIWQEAAEMARNLAEQYTPSYEGRMALVFVLKDLASQFELKGKE